MLFYKRFFTRSHTNTLVLSLTQLKRGVGRIQKQKFGFRLQNIFANAVRPFTLKRNDSIRFNEINNVTRDFQCLSNFIIFFLFVRFLFFNYN